MKKNVNGLVVTILILLTLLVLMIYWSKFNIYKLSDNPGDWASFGAYFSGLLLPIYAAFNIFFFIMLMSKTIKTDEVFFVTKIKKELFDSFINDLNFKYNYQNIISDTNTFKQNIKFANIDLGLKKSNLDLYFSDFINWPEILELEKIFNDLSEFFRQTNPDKSIITLNTEKKMINLIYYAQI